MVDFDKKGVNPCPDLKFEPPAEIRQSTDAESPQVGSNFRIDSNFRPIKFDP